MEEWTRDRRQVCCFIIFFLSLLCATTLQRLILSHASGEGSNTKGSSVSLGLGGSLDFLWGDWGSIQKVLWALHAQLLQHTNLHPLASLYEAFNSVVLELLKKRRKIYNNIC